MTFGKSGLQVHDLNELETLGVLDTAIENASMRRDSSPAAVAQTEADRVHGGMLSSVIIAGYFPITPIPGLGPLSPKLNNQQSLI
jgi:hypothetical protein